MSQRPSFVTRGLVIDSPVWKELPPPSPQGIRLASESLR